MPDLDHINHQGIQFVHDPMSGELRAIIEDAPELDDGTNVVTAAQARGHLDDTGNPHGVTAAQAGADPDGSAAAVQGNLDTHEADTTNPHGVTAAQAGADPDGSAAAVQGNLDTHEADTSNPHGVEVDLRLVAHGTVGATPRPTAAVVLWRGPARPDNAQDGDLWDPEDAGPLWKRHIGAWWGAKDVLSDDMILTMETTTASEEVLIPLSDTVDVSIDWGDGSVAEPFTTANPTHTYASAGTYTVRVSGSAGRLGDSARDTRWTSTIKAVHSFGELGFTSFDTAFRDVTTNLQVPSRVPSSVSNMNYMFRNTPFNRDIGGWDVSNVTTMRFMFKDSAFNQDIGRWDVSNMTDMYHMFLGSPFNQDIGKWDVSNVTDMGHMFEGTPFNQDIGGWDVSKNTQFRIMFARTPFNQDISAWDVSAATTMQQMFFDSPFNQDIGGWDVSNVKDMLYMFMDSPFNHDISAWDYSGLDNQWALDNFFAGADLDTSYYDALLIRWSDQADAGQITPTLSPEMGTSTYTPGGTAEAARTNLINTHGWTITDGGTA